ncbi:MAG: hypothetical protein HZA54_13845 [Planctomycetes bacterium]|nr:hypothetical protein [Planctomycetota bacterium]
MSVPPVRPLPSLATLLAALLAGAAALAQDTPLLPAPPPLAPPPRLFAPYEPSPAARLLLPPPPEHSPDAPAADAPHHPAGEGGYSTAAPIAGLFDLQAFGTAEYRTTGWYRDDYDYETFYGSIEARLLAPSLPALSAVHVEPFVRTVLAGNAASAEEADDPYYENIFLYGAGLAWRPVRCFPVPATEAPGDATLYDWLEPLRVYAQKDWWAGLRSELDPLPRDDWRVGIDYYLQTRSVSQPHHHPLWAEIFWDFRWHDTNFFHDDFRTWVFSSSFKAGVNAPYLGRTQAVQPYLAVDVNASGDPFYGFNRVSAGGGVRLTIDLPLARTGSRWTLRTHWFAEYQQEIGYFGGDRAPDTVNGPEFDARFGVSFSLNRY